MAKSKKPKPQRVLGTIKGENKESLAGLLVQVFEDRKDGEPRLLGTALTNKKGEYEIRYRIKETEFEDPQSRKDLFVRVLSTDGNLLEQSDIKKNVKEKASINLDNIRDPNKARSDLKTYELYGKVVSPKAKGVPKFNSNRPICSGFRVQKNDQQAIGRPVVTDRRGQYKLAINAEEVHKHSAGSPDIIVKAMDNKGTTLQQAVRFNIGARTEVNLLLSTRMYQPPSEYETIDEKLKAELPDGVFAQRCQRKSARARY